MVWDRQQSRDSGHFWLYLKKPGFLLGRLPWPFFLYNSLPLSKLHYCLPGGSVCPPLKICQGAGIDKEFNGTGSHPEILDISGWTQTFQPLK